MKHFEATTKKIMSWTFAQSTVRAWQAEGKKVVFTNGCFDLLHFGHIHYLCAARDLGDKLVLGLNNEESVRRLKGEHRPIQDEVTRAHALAAMHFVDAVVFFAEDTPWELISVLRPNVLVKGGDYEKTKIVGAEMVESYGGNVEVIPFVEGYSTSRLEEKIINSNSKKD